MPKSSIGKGHFRVGTVVYAFAWDTKDTTTRPIAMCANVHVAQAIVEALQAAST